MKKILEWQGFLCGMACSVAVHAGPADYLFTPHVDAGERELDVKYGVASAPSGPRPQAASVGLGYGVNEHWFTEVYLKQKQNAAGTTSYAEWENRLVLSGAGRLDIGLVVELEAPLSGRGAPWELKLGPMLQTRLGQLQLNGNLLFERAFGAADEHGVAYATNLGYQWQARYHWRPQFQFGLQGFGEVGKWDAWDRAADQNHRLGPAVFGKFALEDDTAVKFNAGWLFGASRAAPDHTLRLQAEYEF